jgi:FkbM family methyltransferase
MAKKLSKAERIARRKRVQRRAKTQAAQWPKNSQTDEVLTVEAHGKRMHFYDAMGKLPNCWRVGTMYERSLLEHIYAQEFKGVAVDMGANVGNHTIWFAVVCGLDVVAFEPIKYEELKANVALNNLTLDVQIECVALGHKETTAAHQGLGKLATGKGELPVRTLDSYELNDVSMIKADIEGMESLAFMGARDTITKCRPVIFAEQWTDKEHKAISKVLEPLGYEMTHVFTGKQAATPVGRWDPKQ